jgi:hypothetical protein
MHDLKIFQYIFHFLICIIFFLIFNYRNKDFYIIHSVGNIFRSIVGGNFKSFLVEFSIRAKIISYVPGKT